MSARAVLAIHGGAGIISKKVITPEKERAFREALNDILRESVQSLKEGKSALDVVTQAVVRFEDCPLFNAGKGAVYTRNETHEMDALIMDGTTKAAGGVTCVHNVRNPILAARVVMEKTPHVLMADAGAEAFLREQGVAFEPDEYFHTEHRLAQLHAAKKANFYGMVLDHNDMVTEKSEEVSPLDEKTKYGTVGAVALDLSGRLAAATSTGGMTNKLPSRVGDTPIVGAGCYADDLVAVSCTGTGEFFMRATTAVDLAARMRYQGISLKQAGDAAVHELGRLGGNGGLIAVDAAGHVSLPFISEGMYRGWASSDGGFHVALYGQEENDNS